LRDAPFKLVRTSPQRRRILEERAAQMRHAPTPSEALLFEAVRGRALGVSFRRQVTLLGRFIADLYAPEVRLVVEVDGLYHTRCARSDARRDHALLRAGYYVLRLEAALVMRDLDAAVARVRAAVEGLR
jgi:very-short-patch-repair endonuclease